VEVTDSMDLENTPRIFRVLLAITFCQILRIPTACTLSQSGYNPSILCKAFLLKIARFHVVRISRVVAHA